MSLGKSATTEDLIHAAFLKINLFLKINYILIDNEIFYKVISHK